MSLNDQKSRVSNTKIYNRISDPFANLPFPVLSHFGGVGLTGRGGTPLPCYSFRIIKMKGDFCSTKSGKSSCKTGLRNNSSSDYFDAVIIHFCFNSNLYSQRFQDGFYILTG